MQQPEIGRSTATFVPDETLVAVIEMSLSTWLVAGLVPGVDRRPLKTLSPDENDLLLLLDGWELCGNLGDDGVNRAAYRGG
ncbi:hypothetical protein [Azospirillum sp. B510]|uniref:hypothetical protein n=1 Tax=Azospirillum sp. (strain B510) TaxID=137722 RepID=UPI0002DED9F3|nr:hypothetical protein [Azospirillum sp. B510]